MISIVSGSPRKNSNTLRLANALKNALTESTENETINIIDFNGFDIPSMNVGGLNAENLSVWQKQLFDSLSQSHLIIILSPEYNWFPSAEVIQMIHSFGTPKYAAMWNEKVFAVGGVSSGRGGRIPAVQLSYSINKILNVFNFDSIVSAKMLESQFTPEALNENGELLNNEEYNKGLKAFVSYTLKTASRWQK